MQINSINSTTTNKNSINFNGFVDKSLIGSIQRRSLRMVGHDLFDCGDARKSLQTIDMQKQVAASLIRKLKDAMAGMHPATGLYKEEPDTYLVLRNSITKKKLDIIKISDRDYGIRLSDGLSKVKRTGRDTNPTIMREDYPDIAANIKENTSVYDEKLGANEISDSELQAFKKKEELDVVVPKKKNAIKKFIDKLNHRNRINKTTHLFCRDKRFASLYKKALEEYYSMFSDLRP